MLGVLGLTFGAVLNWLVCDASAFASIQSDNRRTRRDKLHDKGQDNLLLSNFIWLEQILHIFQAPFQAFGLVGVFRLFVQRIVVFSGDETSDRGRKRTGADRRVVDDVCEDTTVS